MHNIVYLAVLVNFRLKFLMFLIEVDASILNAASSNVCMNGWD